MWEIIHLQTLGLCSVFFQIFFCKLRIILVHINLNDNEMFNMISWIDALFIQQPQQPSSVDLDYNLSLYLLIYDLYNQIYMILYEP